VVEGKGRPGFVSGQSLITLTPSGASVIVDVRGDVRVGGLVAQVGQRLLGAAARTMMDRFFNCLRLMIEESG
jgi:carbon monoxide dehydrogenase subunit G